MRVSNENKQTIYDHYVQKYHLREPKILLYDLSQVVNIHSLKRADLQLNSSKNGCNIAMDDDIPLKYLLQTKSEDIRMNSMKNIRLVSSKTFPIDIKLSNIKTNINNETLHYKKRNVKSIIYKFIRLKHKIYKITDLTLICRKCNHICDNFECFEKHCALKHKYIIRKHNNAETSNIFEETEPNFCNICSKSFNNYWQLRKHVKRKHDLKLNHRCELCLQNYRSKTLLKIHLRKHELDTQISEETHFELSTEPQEDKDNENIQDVHYYYNSKMEQEMKLNEEIYSKKSVKVKRSHIVYLCTLCSKTFQLESDLIKHRQILKCSFTCDECGHLFRRHYRIREHMIKYHHHLYIPTKKIRQTNVEKPFKKIGNSESKIRNLSFETPMKEKLRELKIVIRKTSIEECKNMIESNERNNNITSLIENSEPIIRKRKSSHSSQLLYNPFNKNNHQSKKVKNNTINNEISYHTQQLPVEGNKTSGQTDMLSHNLTSKHKINSPRTDIKEISRINTSSNDDNKDLIDKSENSMIPIARELRERNAKWQTEDGRKDNLKIANRRRSTRLSSHKAENREIIETIMESKQTVIQGNGKKSISELKKHVNVPVIKQATKRKDADANLSKRVTRKSSRTNQEESVTVTDTIITSTADPLEVYSDIENHSKREKKKIKARPKRNSRLENTDVPFKEIISIKEEIDTQAIIEIEVPLFKEATLVDSKTVKAKLRPTTNGKSSVEQEVNMVKSEKKNIASVPETNDQEQSLTPEDLNVIIKEEPIIKEEIINFNEYIGPTTGNSRHKYKCLICDRTFGNFSNALRHVGFKHFNKYPCILCPESFAEERQLKIHTDQVHVTPKLTTIIPDMEIKTSPHREDEILDPVSHINESFESNKLGFVVENGISPQMVLKTSPHYDNYPIASELNTLLEEETSNTDYRDATTRIQNKIILFDDIENIIPVSVLKSSPRLDLENLTISLPTQHIGIMSPILGPKDALTPLGSTYSPLESSELFCNVEDDKSFSSENEIFLSLNALVNGQDELDFKTTTFHTDSNISKDFGCSEKNGCVPVNNIEKTDINGRIPQHSSPSGSALNNNLHHTDSCTRNFESANIINERKKQQEEKRDSGIGIGEKDFELPENLYKGWFETKSIDPSDEISFDNNNEVTFSEVGIEFA